MHRQHVTRALDLRGDLALLLGGEAGVLARQDLAGVRDKAAHQLGARERNFLGLEGLGLGFGRAHDWKKEVEGWPAVLPCQRAFLVCQSPSAGMSGNVFSPRSSNG